MESITREDRMGLDQEPDTQPMPVPAEADTEVDYAEVMEEAKQEEERVSEAQQREEEDVLDVLVPKAEIKQWTIGSGELQRTYVQRPLSFIAKMQWFSLVGEVLDKAMSGEGALTVGNLLSAPSGRGQSLTMTDFRDADTFVHAIGKLLIYAPDFLQRSYCIWLNVPDFERDVVMELMKQPPEEGGLTDEDGIEIIEIFIDQNYEALDRFFRDRLGDLQKRLQARAKQAQGSRQSRR